MLVNCCGTRKSAHQQFRRATNQLIVKQRETGKKIPATTEKGEMRYFFISVVFRSAAPLVDGHQATPVRLLFLERRVRAGKIYTGARSTRGLFSDALVFCFYAI